MEWKRTDLVGCVLFYSIHHHTTSMCGSAYDTKKKQGVHSCILTRNSLGRNTFYVGFLIWFRLHRIFILFFLGYMSPVVCFLWMVLESRIEVQDNKLYSSTDASFDRSDWWLICSSPFIGNIICSTAYCSCLLWHLWMHNFEWSLSYFLLFSLHYINYTIFRSSIYKRKKSNSFHIAQMQ